MKLVRYFQLFSGEIIKINHVLSTVLLEETCLLRNEKKNKATSIPHSNFLSSCIRLKTLSALKISRVCVAPVANIQMTLVIFETNCHFLMCTGEKGENARTIHHFNGYLHKWLEDCFYFDVAAVPEGEIPPLPFVPF